MMDDMTRTMVEVSAEEISAALETGHGETSLSMINAEDENDLICLNRPWSVRARKALDPVDYAVHQLGTRSSWKSCSRDNACFVRVCALKYSHVSAWCRYRSTYLNERRQKPQW